MKTRITELFNIKHPIIQGGMHYVGYAELASAVSNAGGLGIITALTQPTPDDLAREIAVLADRTDIAEELTRLTSHLEQLEALFSSAKPVGRQLDFLVQELHREVNTIGSKCNDATVAHWVIEAKTCVERMREQVQNVE